MATSTRTPVPETRTVPLRVQKRPVGRFLIRFIIIVVTATLIIFSCLGVPKDLLSQIVLFAGDGAFLIAMAVLWWK